MFKYGLGDSAKFAGFHPFVNLIYFAFATGITVFSLSPWFLLATFVFSWAYSILLKGYKAIKYNLIFSISVLVVMAIINTLFVNNGATVMFYLNGSPVTLEAFIYGVSAAVMLISIIIWFSCFNVIMSSDKLIYIFGKTAPVLGLTLSMVFRFIPLLKERFREIRMGQKAMGRHNQQGFVNKGRQLVKEISILISWSLEASIESADSMEARGYGLKGRTSFHLYKFTRRDVAMIVLVILLGAVVTAGVIMGKTDVFFYPVYRLGHFDVFTGIILACYCIMLALPVIIDIKGEWKWKQLNLEM